MAQTSVIVVSLAMLGSLVFAIFVAPVLSEMVMKRPGPERDGKVRLPDRLVKVVTLEGDETVRAGDFYLAKGVQGEVWPYPKEKIKDVMVPAE